MIVDVDVVRLTMFRMPLKDEPPLIIDAYGMPAWQYASQLLKMIAGKRKKISI